MFLEIGVDFMEMKNNRKSKRRHSIILKNVMGEKERDQLLSDVKSTRVSYIRCCPRVRVSVALDSLTIEISAKQTKQGGLLCVIGKLFICESGNHHEVI